MSLTISADICGGCRSRLSDRRKTRYQMCCGKIVCKRCQKKWNAKSLCAACKVSTALPQSAILQRVKSIMDNAPQLALGAPTSGDTIAAAADAAPEPAASAGNVEIEASAASAATPEDAPPAVASPSTALGAANPDAAPNKKMGSGGTAEDSVVVGVAVSEAADAAIETAPSLEPPSSAQEELPATQLDSPSPVASPVASPSAALAPSPVPSPVAAPRLIPSEPDLGPALGAESEVSAGAKTLQTVASDLSWLREAALAPASSSSSSAAAAAAERVVEAAVRDSHQLERSEASPQATTETEVAGAVGALRVVPGVLPVRPATALPCPTPVLPVFDGPSRRVVRAPVLPVLSSEADRGEDRDHSDLFCAIEDLDSVLRTRAPSSEPLHAPARARSRSARRASTGEPRPSALRKAL